jgi:hypothetical protein
MYVGTYIMRKQVAFAMVRQAAAWEGLAYISLVIIDHTAGMMMQASSCELDDDADACAGRPGVPSGGVASGLSDHGGQ